MKNLSIHDIRRVMSAEGLTQAEKDVIEKLRLEVRAAAQGLLVARGKRMGLTETEAQAMADRRAGDLQDFAVVMTDVTATDAMDKAEEWIAASISGRLAARQREN